MNIVLNGIVLNGSYIVKVKKKKTFFTIHVAEEYSYE